MSKEIIDSLKRRAQNAQTVHAQDRIIEELQATNQELLSALEWIVSEIKDCAQPEDWESFDSCEKAITNARQAMPDEPTS